MLKSPRMYILTLFVSTLNKFSLKMSTKFVWFGGRVIVRTATVLVFDDNN